MSERLRIMIQASNTFWKNAEIKDATTHPLNEDVEAWLVNTGKFKPTIAEKAASLVRPEWATRGRRPEK